VKRLHWVILGVLVTAATAVTLLLWPDEPAPQPVTYGNISRNARICLANTSASDASIMWRAVQAEAEHEPVNAQHLVSPNHTPDAVAPFFNGVLALHCRLIVTTGEDMHDAVISAAKSHPDQAFASDDRSIHLPNVRRVDTAPEIAQLVHDIAIGR
jgi:hypothetical protein